MRLVLAGVGVLGCLAMMLGVMPPAIRVARRLRRATAEHAPRSTHPRPLPHSGPRRSGADVAEAERADVVVVGGGQAGLAASYYLSQAELPHVILDAERRVGDAWRRRWDSLELFSAARYSALPGLPFPGDPQHFPGKDEVADYLEGYARTFQLPVTLNARVRSLRVVASGYRLDTDAGAYQGGQVIVATGA